MKCSNSIAGYITAQRDLWIVGDKFIDQIFHRLQELKQEAKEAQGPMPYMYDYYEIKCYTEDKLSTNDCVPSRIVN